MTTELLERDLQLGNAPEGLEADLALLVEQVLEEAERERAAESVKEAQWGYRVPFAGVRYYTF